jgi:hypothetical protein
MGEKMYFVVTGDCNVFLDGFEPIASLGLP